MRGLSVVRVFQGLILLAGLSMSSLGNAGEEAGARAKAIADAGKAEAEANRLNLLSPAEKEKLEAETAKLIAEAYKLVSEAHLNEARTQQIYQEIEALRQRMRIAEYEFQRIASADYELRRQLDELERNMNLVKPLVFGRCNWKTWLGLEYLMLDSGDMEIIIQVMFDVPVPVLNARDFVSNVGGSTQDFTGGNLGELYNFVRDNDYSFRAYTPAHKNIMKVVAMISKAVELKEQELRDINQAIRLTIVKISNT